MPKVSIGLPVYNGENFLAEAIESILGQTFEDFELIISDNCSTDATAAICQTYASRDKRIRYFRNEENIGASGNFIRVYRLSSAELFKWAAHDDVYRPEFLARCVKVLYDNPATVLSYTRAIAIDAHGTFVQTYPARPNLSSQSLLVRFQDTLRTMETIPIWGVVRKTVLGKTRLLGNYASPDIPLLAELSLYGQFAEIPNFLFCLREHPQRSIHVYDYRKPHEAIAFYDPKRAGQLTFPLWRVLREILAGINRAPLTARARLGCYAGMHGWLGEHAYGLLLDILIAAQYLPVIGPSITRFHARYSAFKWRRLTELAQRDLSSVIPSGDTFVLVDDGQCNPEAFSAWRSLLFIEKEGQYWGSPENDQTAQRELARLRNSGASFIAFLWPAFWWFEFYKGFSSDLHRRFVCVLKTKRVVVFKLQ